MNSNATLIGILLLLVFIVPIFYAIIKSNAKKRKSEGITQKLINQHQLSPTYSFNDLGEQQFILDAKAKKLLHFKIEKSNEPAGTLWSIDEIKAINPHYSYYTSPSNQRIIDKINLHVVEKDGDKKTIQIYDETTGNINEVDHYKSALENLVSKVNSLRH